VVVLRAVKPVLYDTVHLLYRYAPNFDQLLPSCTVSKDSTVRYQKVHEDVVCWYRSSTTAKFAMWYNECGIVREIVLVVNGHFNLL
jgi:hypothetical protein